MFGGEKQSNIKKGFSERSGQRSLMKMLGILAISGLTSITNMGDVMAQDKTTSTEGQVVPTELIQKNEASDLIGGSLDDLSVDCRNVTDKEGICYTQSMPGRMSQNIHLEKSNNAYSNSSNPIESNSEPNFQNTLRVKLLNNKVIGYFDLPGKGEEQKHRIVFKP